MAEMLALLRTMRFSTGLRFSFSGFFSWIFSRCFIAAFSVDRSYELRPYSVVSDLYFSEQSPDGVVAGHSRHRL